MNKEINKVEIRPTTENLKEIVWREIQKAMFNKESTTFLTKGEVTQVYDVMTKKKNNMKAFFSKNNLRLNFIDDGNIVII